MDAFIMTTNWYGSDHIEDDADLLVQEMMEWNGLGGAVTQYRSIFGHVTSIERWFHWSRRCEVHACSRKITYNIIFDLFGRTKILMSDGNAFIFDTKASDLVDAIATELCWDRNIFVQPELVLFWKLHYLMNIISISLTSLSLTDWAT